MRGYVCGPQDDKTQGCRRLHCSDDNGEAPTVCNLVLMDKSRCQGTVFHEVPIAKCEPIPPSPSWSRLR